MELLLSKSQKKGMLGMGSITFILNIKAKLTEEESELVNRYKMGSVLVYEKVPLSEAAQYMSNTRVFLTAIASRVLKLQFTVNDLVNGRTIECKDIGEMLSAHEQIEQAASNFYDLLMSAKHFEGDEVLTFPRPL